MSTLGPRVVIAGTHSGVGKTTVATGIMAALRRRGLKVGSAKVGPDYIDPGYHRLATGTAPRNLDSFLVPESLIPALAARAGDQMDVLVVEGVMGLFDGASSPSETSSTGLPAASTAAIAALIDSPVVLVVDASSMSQSVAALVHGYASWSPGARLSGVVLNRVGSDAHEEALRRALEPAGIPILGALRRDPAFSWRDRHLGLVPVVERPAEIQAALGQLASAVERSIDLEAIVAVARGAPPVVVSTPLPVPGSAPATDPAPATRRQGEGPGRRPTRIAVAGGPAFSFVYPDNLEMLAQAGAELVPFDPLRDQRLPEGVRGLYAGGGFPEVYAAELASNRPLLDEVAGAAFGGLPIWAECGGLLWLAASLDGHALCGTITATGHMTERLTLGYRSAEVLVDNPVAPAGTQLRGHEFHYSVLEPGGEALRVANHRATWLEGHASTTMLATYLHLHLAAMPEAAERFAAAAAGARTRSALVSPDGRTT